MGGPKVEAVSTTVPAEVVTGNSCTLYSSDAIGSSVKEAVFKPEMIGTPGLKQGVVFDSYAPYNHCMVYATAVSHSWCECPRENNRIFEDSVEKMNPKGRIVWIGSKGKSE